MALVGNKADLQENREVPAQVSVILYVRMLHLFLCIPFHRICFNTCVFLFLKDGIEYAEKNGMFFIETSAKTADNINQLFEVRLHIYFLIATIFYL